MTKLNIEMDYLSLSHSLRIPLTEILGMTELLYGEKLSPLQHEEVEAIRQASQRLLFIVNQLLKSPESDIKQTIVIH
jgi:signal transduction histidine kinase